jgi:peroxiredoxin
MPNVGMQMPIPRAAPAAASATSASTPMPALTATPYPSQAAPPVTRGGAISGAGRRGLTGIATTILILIVCFLVGSGIYYFVNQAGTSSPNNNTVDNTPPSIQNIKISAITETGATINWKTDKLTTGKVEYWKTGTDVPSTTLDNNLSNSHSVKLSGLASDTTYYFKIISTDAAGNEATAQGDLKAKPLASADETPPAISGINVSNITESSAIITWQTDETATSQVNYGKTETYGSTMLDEKLTIPHTVTLTGLDDGTTYNFQVISKDSSGNTATSPTNQTFETPAGIPVGCGLGDRAPDFTVQNLDGEDVFVKLSDYRGKIVMLNFWYTTCDPCLTEMPWIQAVSDNWSGEKDLVILTIADSYWDSIDNVNEFIEGEGYTFPVFYDSERQAKSLYSISFWPTTYFIDTEGIIWHMEFGRVEHQAALEAILDSL